MGNVKRTKTTPRHQRHRDFVVSPRKSLTQSTPRKRLVRRKFIKTSPAFSTDRPFTDKEPVPFTIVEDVDGSLISMDIEAGSNAGRGIANLPILRPVRWRHDTDRIPVIKDVVTVSNRDAINLHARGRELKGSQVCSSCEIGLGPFVGCVVDISSDPPLSFGSCTNCIWGAHPDRCSLREFQFCPLKR